MLKEFNNTNGYGGYYDIFMPAMKKLNGSYADYFRKVETASKRFIFEYPEFAE